MNKITIIGNLTRDPELRVTQTGLPVCSFTVAVNRRRQQNGEEKTDFFDVVAWRQLADICGRFLQKGKKVAVVGEMQQSTYEGRDGTTKTKWSVVAGDVEFLTPAGSAQGAGNPAYTPPVPPPPVPHAPPSEHAAEGFTQAEDEELPF